MKKECFPINSVSYHLAWRREVLDEILKSYVPRRLKSWKPDIAVKWWKWTIGFWRAVMRNLFSLWFWKYALDDSRADKDFGNFVSRCLCRARGHRAGVFWYCASCLEPDMHCKGCGEDMG